MKKTLALLLAIIMVLALWPASALATFSDTSSHWATSSIDRWSENGIVKGYEDGSFQPEAKVTRAETATMLTRMLFLQEKSSAKFADVAENDWFYDYVSKCAAAGILKGDGAGMKPDDAVTRQDAIVMIGRAFQVKEAASGAEKFSDAGKIADYAKGYVNAFAAAGYVNGYAGFINPEDNITRAELVTILDNMVAYYINEPGTYSITGNKIAIVNSSDVKLNKTGFTGTVIETPITKYNGSLVAAADTGTYVGAIDDNGILTYKGVKFADAERWQLATASRASTDIVEAYEYGYLPVQRKYDAATQSEDELYLNIYMNSKSTAKNRPVLFVSPVGGGTGSSGNSTDPTQFLLENPDMIVVVGNSRVSYFGCLNLTAFEDYDKYGDVYESSNNLIKTDLITSLQWVNKNIKAFGGDPDNVTIYGYSAGGATVSALLLIDGATDYFDKIIQGSGVSIDDISLASWDESLYCAEKFKEATGVTTIEEALKLDPQVLLDAQAYLTKDAIGAYLPGFRSKTFASVIDNVVIHDNYWDNIVAAADSGILMMTGTTNGEYDNDLSRSRLQLDASATTAEYEAAALNAIVSANWCKLDPTDPNYTSTRTQAEVDAIIKGYVDRGNTMYSRDTVTSYKDLKNDINQKCSAVIISEAFNAVAPGSSRLFSWEWYVENENGARATHGSWGTTLWGTSQSNAPEAIGKAFRKAFASFCTYGDPNTNNEYFKSAGINWSTYSNDTHSTMVFGSALKVENGQRVADIESLLPLFNEYESLMALRNGVYTKTASGTYIGHKESNGMVTYRNVKFADFEPFQAPVVATDNGTVLCLEAGPASNNGAEGCLNASIFLNPNYTGERHVYVYQYGSAQAGGTNARMDWSQFVEENPDIIVVTPNHRGGFFGSIDLSQLAGYSAVADKYMYSNNLARLDILACLKWVSGNIADFGGDPADVTIGGHSSGSNNMTCMLMMEEAQPYFEKAICQASFSCDISLESLDTAKFVSGDLFDRLGVKTIDEFLALSNDEIAAGQKQIQANSASGATAYANIENKLFSPVVDGVVIPEDYYDRLLSGQCAGKTVIFGSNAGEYDQQFVDKEGNPLSDEAALAFTVSQNWGKLSDRGWNKANAQAVLDEFFSHNTEYGRDSWTAAKDLKNDLYLRCGAIMYAEALSQYTDVYFYHLDWDITPENNLRASHGSENDVIMRLWSKVPENMLGGAEMISTTWATFIRSGDPNNKLLPDTWELYNGETHNTLYIAPDAKNSHMVNGWRQKDVDLLLPLLREYPKLAASKVKTSAPGEYNGYSYQVYNGYNRYSLYVPVTDGTKIAVDYYIPTLNGTEATGALPTVFTWTPYNRARYASDGSIAENTDAAYFTSYGYAFAIADCRGMGASYGTRDSANSPQEAQDGADIVQWIYNQPWCNKKIGTIGSSYVGQTQLSILSKSKLVTASVIGCTDYNKYDGWIRGGVPRAFGSQPDTLWTAIGGTVTVESVVAKTVPVDADKNKTMLTEAVSQHVTNGLQIPMFQRLLWRDSYSAEVNGEYWNMVSASTNAKSINTSGSHVYLLGGLYDVFRRDTFVEFANMENAEKMTIGPWYHTKPKLDPDWTVEQLRWFDYWLKGIDNGIADEEPIYLKTANETENNGYSFHSEWPGYTGKGDSYYLTEGTTGTIASVNDDVLATTKNAAASYVDYKAVYGIKTGVENDDAIDVDTKGLTFTTAAMTKDYEITGHPMAHINFELLTAGYDDIDVFVTLSDYDPATGKAFIFSDGHIRASLRGTEECPYDFLGLPWHPADEEDADPITTGKVYGLEIDLMPTSYVVKEGHSIRVTISNAMDRFYYLGRSEYEANANCETPTTRIYTGGENASYIVFPNVYAE